MKFTIIYAAVPGFEHKLGRITKVFAETLSELSVDVSEQNLALSGLGQFDGKPYDAANAILADISESRCLIFASVAHMGHLNALMQNFIEHLSKDEFRAALAGKTFYSVVVSPDGSELAACAYLSGLYALLSGFDGGRMAVGARYAHELDGLDENKETREIIERQAEDLYRQLSQSRRQFIPSLAKAPDGQGANPKKKRRQSRRQPEESPVQKPENSPSGFIPLYNNAVYEPEEEQAPTVPFKGAFSGFSEEEEAQIAEISEFLANSSPAASKQRGTARLSPCRNLTRSLTHSFQPMAAGDLAASFQVSISGEETFDCHLNVSNGACQYNDGSAANPDIVIMADSKVWTDMLNGKMTCQRAFMGGKIKVRGNFVLLSKFDQMFGAERR